MGRREDGAAVGTRPEMRPDPTGSMTGEIPPSTDAAPRAWSNALRDPRAMAGLRSRAIGPGARSWLTGVAGPRSRKRGPTSRRTPQVERRKARSSASQRRNGTLARRPTGRVSQTAHRGPRKPQRLPALRSPRWEPGIAIRNEGLPGADQRTRAMNHVHRHSGARAESAFTRVFEEHARTRNPDTRTDERSEPRTGSDSQVLRGSAHSRRAPQDDGRGPTTSPRALRHSNVPARWRPESGTCPRSWRRSTPADRDLPCPSRRRAPECRCRRLPRSA